MKNFIVDQTTPSSPRSARLRLLASALVLLAGCIALPAVAQTVSISQSPLTTPSQVPNNMVLVPSVEWPTVVTHANNPGVSEGSANYSPTTTYTGYFNPNLCYAYHYEATEANRYFYPDEATGTNHSCNGKTGGTAPDPTNQRLWSGNFMNWSALQAIDTFRLALTGGYRVRDTASLTYLEKANSDRLDNSYTPLRRLAANVTDATPSTATTFRTRIGGLRSQLWFNQNTSATLGSTGYGYSDPHALTQPVTDGLQSVNRANGTDTDTTATAMPYDPSFQGISMAPSADANSVGAANSTACTAGEPGCTTINTCPNGGTLSGSTCGAQSVQACTVANRTFFRTSGTRCRQTNNDTSSFVAAAALCSVAGAVVPANGNVGGNCTLAAYAATPTYTHTTYGRNQVWAVSVRVKVCDGTLDVRSDLCTPYGVNFKPEGLLQRNAAKTRFSLFSYMTQDGGSSRRGGVMRARQKLIGPVVSGEQPYPFGHLPDDSATGASGSGRISGIDNPEWNGTTGVFIDNPDSADATATSTNIAAGSGTCVAGSTPDGSACAIQYSGVINYINRFGQLGTGLATLKGFDNLSEMYYTALRYLRGLANVSSFSSFAGGSKIGNYQNADGLPVIDDWYGNGANTAVTQWASGRTVGKMKDPSLYQCQSTVVLGIGDTATQNESDDYSSDTSSTSVPGSSFATISRTTMQAWRNATDGGSGASSRLNTAGLAYWAHLNDLRPDIPNTPIPATASDSRGQSISTYWVDVVELANLKSATDNQYYNATKYGGFTIPDSFYAGNGGNGNAARPLTTWFGTSSASSNWNTWTTATQTIVTGTSGLSNGNYYQPNNMYLGNNGAAMVTSLNSAFTRIAADIAGSGASLAANSTQLGTGTTTYQAVYFTGEWRGDLVAYRVCTGDTSVPGCATQPSGAIATSPAWKASTRLPAPASRTVYTCTGTCVGQSTAVRLAVQATTTLTLSPTLESSTANYLCVNSSSCATGEQTAMVNYLLGTDGSLRRRPTTPLGDIVDSQPVYVGQPSASQYSSKTFAAAFASFAGTTSIKNRRNTIYVAANDGMVHAFHECTMSSTGACTSSTPQQGTEVYAYLPKAVIRSGISRLAQSSYGSTTNPHQFFNDGELTVMDIECASSACPNAVGGWATVLIGSTGRGPAKAVYALDVTDPTNIVLLWERSATDGSSLDSNSGYIGQMTGKPVVARLADGTWAALMGNGYNSTQNTPALLQFDIATGTLSVYTTTGAAGDGLAAPAVWIGDATLNANVSTQAYAGDLQGNVWAFTLTATGGSGTLIYSAKTSANVAQPITAGIIATKNPQDNKVWIFFGTGSVLGSFSSTDNQSNTWYGLIVQGTDAVTSSKTRSDLRQRTIAAENAATSTSLAVRGISVATAGDLAGKSGWYIDLISPAGAQAERMVTSNQFQGSLLLGTSRIPSTSNSDPCNPSGGKGWIMAINPYTGTAASQSFFDANNNNVFTDDLAHATNPDSSVTYYTAAGVGFDATANNPIFVGHDMLVSFSNATTGNVNTRGTISTLQRLSWRELVGQ